MREPNPENYDHLHNREVAVLKPFSKNAKRFLCRFGLVSGAGLVSSLTGLFMQAYTAADETGVAVLEVTGAAAATYVLAEVAVFGIKATRDAHTTMVQNQEARLVVDLVAGNWQEDRVAYLAIPPSQV